MLAIIAAVAGCVVLSLLYADPEWVRGGHAARGTAGAGICEQPRLCCRHSPW